MNAEEILAMEAGRELDVLVAQEIFGIEVEWDYLPWDVGKILPKQPFTKGKSRIGLGPTAHPIVLTIGEYSADIDTAWQVVERLRSLEDSKGNLLLCCLEIYSDHNYCWEIRWSYSELSICNDSHKRHSTGCFDTLPEAICKAVLLVKLGEGVR